MKSTKNKMSSMGKSPLTVFEKDLINNEIAEMEEQIALMKRYDDLRTNIIDVRGRFRMMVEKHGAQCPDDHMAAFFFNAATACHIQDALNHLEEADLDKAKASLKSALMACDLVITPTSADDKQAQQ